MPFTVEDFHDLVRLLEERPEWRAEMRRLLCDEYLAVPGHLVGRRPARRAECHGPSDAAGQAGHAGSAGGSGSVRDRAGSRHRAEPQRVADAEQAGGRADRRSCWRLMIERGWCLSAGLDSFASRTPSVSRPWWCTPSRLMAGSSDATVPWRTRALACLSENAIGTGMETLVVLDDSAVYAAQS